MVHNDNPTEIIVSEDEIDEESLIKAVADAIARLQDAEPTDIPPLYYTVNTEALNELFESSEDDEYLRFKFTHAEYEVTIEKAENITVTVSRT